MYLKLEVRAFETNGLCQWTDSNGLKTNKFWLQKKLSLSRVGCLQILYVMCSSQYVFTTWWLFALLSTVKFN